MAVQFKLNHLQKDETLTQGWFIKVKLLVIVVWTEALTWQECSRVESLSTSAIEVLSITSGRRMGQLCAELSDGSWGLTLIAKLATCAQTKINQQDQPCGQFDPVRINQ